MAWKVFSLGMILLTSLGACTTRTPLPGPACGNGRLDPGEPCDGIYLLPWGDTTCADLGYNSPDLLTCTSSCELDASHCEASGVCGDGWITPGWEACDGKQNGAATCETLGFHAGPLFCTPQCTYDTSRCPYCGDGVLQEDAGELIESSIQACTGEGYFGGLLFTEDCRTVAEEICGDFALVPPAGSIHSPVFALRADGSIAFSAKAAGAFPGFTHPDPDCPRTMELMEFNPATIQREIVGSFHDPACDTEFFAVRPAESIVEIRAQHPVDAPIVALLDAGGGRVAAISGSPDEYRFLVLDEAGTTLHSLPLSTGRSNPLPQLRRVSDTETGITVMDADGIRFSVFDHTSGELHERLSMRELDFNGEPHPVAPAPAHTTYWTSAHEWFFTIFLDPVGADYQGHRVLARVIELEGQFKVDRIFETSSVPMDVASMMLSVNAADQLELVWLVGEYSEQQVRIKSFTQEGVQIASKYFTFPSGQFIESVFRDDDGTYVAAGWTYTPESPELAPLCRPAETALFSWRLSPDMEVLDTQHFPTSAAAPSPFDTDFCHLNQRHYALRDGTLVIAGTYDRAEGFCSDREVVTPEPELPLHACGIYFVRFGRDGTTTPLRP